MIEMLRNLRKNLGYGGKELSEIIRQVEAERRRYAELRKYADGLENQNELLRIRLRELGEDVGPGGG